MDGDSGVTLARFSQRDRVGAFFVILPMVLLSLAVCGAIQLVIHLEVNSSAAYWDSPEDLPKLCADLYNSLALMWAIPAVTTFVGVVILLFEKVSPLVLLIYMAWTISILFVMILWCGVALYLSMQSFVFRL